MAKSSLGKYLRTIRYLNKKQIFYKIFYLLKNLLPFKKKYNNSNFVINKKFSFNNFIINNQSYLSKNNFRFLNINKKFTSIDWNFMDFGKLWNYNLCYFDFLNQKKIYVDDFNEIIVNFFKFKNHISGYESYTISLRNVNLIKYISKHNIKDEFLNYKLYNSFLRLKDNLEYHILGNHLLENAFSLLFGSIYFNDDSFFEISEKILLDQLDEQILNDGAHFELSPMYHCITLHKVLDSINLLRSNEIFNSKNLEKKLEVKAVKMLSWLSQISFKNNEIPHFNDSTFGIAPKLSDLFNYSKKLNIVIDSIKLSDSGYRKYNGDKYEIVVDYGSIGPTYLPGHGHSDTFNFELHCHNMPIIVDTGISTYENNSIRHIERSTVSHNTLMVDEKNQSEVWSSFRVGQRAEVKKIYEDDNSIIGIHDGYRKKNVFHQRSFHCNKNEIIIEDIIKHINIHNLKSYLHFAPHCKIELKDNQLKINGFIKINFFNYKILEKDRYNYCLGYNKKITAEKIVGTPSNNSKIHISIL